MTSALLGDGSIRIGWDGFDTRPGLRPQLVLKGTLVARGYGVGAVVQIITEVTALDSLGTYSLLGSTTPKSQVLNWAKQQYSHSNSAPPDETERDIELCLPMSPAIIEGLEEFRQGTDFTLQLDTTVLLIEGGEPPEPRTREYYTRTAPRTQQDRLPVSTHDWGKALARWDRGLGIPVIVPLVAVQPDPQRASVVRHLAEAQQRIASGDYTGSFTASRKSLELLRELSTAIRPLPKVLKERDPLQRVYAVIDALFNLASASQHTDPPIRNFIPTRADAVAVAAGTASVAQQVFAQLDRS